MVTERPMTGKPLSTKMGMSNFATSNTQRLPKKDSPPRKLQTASSIEA